MLCLILNNKKIYELVKMLRYTGTKSDPKKIITKIPLISDLKNLYNVLGKIKK